MLIRPATVDDLPVINDIYNHYVLHSTCTYQEDRSTMDERRAWFTNRTTDHPVTVMTDGNEVIGWGALSRFHARSAWRFTVENTVYVKHDQHRRGIGKALLVDLLQRAETIGHRSIIAVIDSLQTPSLGLHRALGFEDVGHFREVGFKFGQWLDVIYLQKQIHQRKN